MRSLLRVLPALALFGAPPARAQNPNTPTLTFDLGGFDPIEITAPREKIKEPFALDPQINATLLRLLQQKSEARPGSEAAFDSSVINLGKLSTVTGFKLKTRYTELGFLLTEGLAGVKDFQLQSALEAVARAADKNPQTRAAAMVALSYTKDVRFRALMTDGLQDQNVTVRLGALEGLEKMADAASELELANVMRGDRSLTMQVLAAAALWRKGNPAGRETLRTLSNHEDWFVRAMAVRYLGELGGGWEYRDLMRLLSTEENDLVKAELCGALLKLEKFKDE